MGYYDDYKKNKILDLGNGMTTNATYDANGRLTGGSGTANVGVAGWQASEPVNQAYGAYDNKYGNEINQGMTTMQKMNRFKDPYANDVADDYGAVKNFSYDAQSDPTYKVYADMFARQGQSAQKQTLSNLTGISGGRNNSYASAATAQVGQAYAQKTADMIPQLAQQAYDKLLQRYNLSSQASNTAYGRQNDAFNRQGTLNNAYSQYGQQEIENNRNQMSDTKNFRAQDQAYDINEINRAYLPQEKELELQNLKDTAESNKIRIAKENIDLAAYPEQTQIGLKLGYISVDQANSNLEGTNIENVYKPKLYNAQIYDAYRPKSSGGSSVRPTQYDKEQGIKSQISQLLYPSNLPEGTSQLYYPIQSLAQNRGILNSNADKAYVDSLIRLEASRVANAEGESYQSTLEKYGFGDLLY